MSCSKCSEEIKADEKQTLAHGKKFHARCFTCAECKKPIDGQFYPKGDGFLCTGCSEGKRDVLGTPGCHTCGCSLEGKFRAYKGHDYCPSCCAKAQKADILAKKQANQAVIDEEKRVAEWNSKVASGEVGQVEAFDYKDYTNTHRPPEESDGRLF